MCVRDVIKEEFDLINALNLKNLNLKNKETLNLKWLY